LGEIIFGKYRVAALANPVETGIVSSLFSREHSSETETKGQTDSSSHRRGQQHVLADVSFYIELFANSVFQFVYRATQTPTLIRRA